MKIIKKNIHPTSKDWVNGAGHFTQVRLSVKFEKSIREMPLVQFYGMTAKLLSDAFIESNQWEVEDE